MPLESGISMLLGSESVAVGKPCVVFSNQLISTCLSWKGLCLSCLRFCLRFTVGELNTHCLFSTAGSHREPRHREEPRGGRHHRKYVRAAEGACAVPVAGESEFTVLRQVHVGQAQHTHGQTEATGGREDVVRSPLPGDGQVRHVISEMAEGRGGTGWVS